MKKKQNELYMMLKKKGFSTKLQTLNSDIRCMGLYSKEVAVAYGLLNTLEGLSTTPSCKQTTQQ